ncbi:MAG: helix-turn-helix transcriptional regulator [Cyanobacteria bacterium]|jgi:transcriptional regulator with XRE-family HTH domain|nr:helix-turn-helix transcriptional regulator [Cyanobacteriota bacterium]
MAPTVSINTASSDRLISFLEETNLHKKDFAEMIGVTLSYVYSLIDREVAFSTRTTTLERIAVVMGTTPETFPEYKRPEEPRLVDPGIEFLKERQGELNLTNVQFLKRFPRNQRVEIVDMWRGAYPMPLDWSQLSAIAAVLELRKDEIYPYWQARIQQYLTSGGIDPLSNIGILNAMFQGIKGYLKIV